MPPKTRKLLDEQVNKWSDISKSKILLMRRKTFLKSSCGTNKQWKLYLKIYNASIDRLAARKNRTATFVRCRTRTVELVNQKTHEWRSNKAKFLFICGLGLHPKASWDGLESTNTEVSNSRQVMASLLRQERVNKSNVQVTPATGTSSSSYTSDDSGLGRCTTLTRSIKRRSHCKKRSKETEGVDYKEVITLESDSEDSDSTIPISHGVERSKRFLSESSTEVSGIDSVIDIDSKTTGRRQRKEEKERVREEKTRSWMSSLPNEIEPLAAIAEDNMSSTDGNGAAAGTEEIKMNSVDGNGDVDDHSEILKALESYPKLRLLIIKHA